MSPCLLVFRCWLTRHERHLRRLVIAVALLIFALQWVRAGSRVEDGDFYLHWQFAGRFVQHQLLYAEGLHVPYPPFWAMAWSPIAALPLSAAKILCYPLSAAALALVLWLLDRQCRDRRPLSSTRRFWAAVAALVIVSRFVVRELPECGPNLMLLACAWSAIYLWTRRRDMPAGICLGFATALKCTPGLFIAYFAWKRQWKLAASGVVAAAAFTLAPALWQGPADYQRHVQIWLANLRFGLDQSDPSVGVLGPETLQNLSLRPAVARFLMHLPGGHPARLGQPAYIDFLDLSPATAGRVSKAVLLILLASVAWLFRKPLADRNDLTVAWECAAVSALSLLLSPITWYQHCVALLPVFYLFTRRFAAGARPARWMLALVIAFFLVVVVFNRGLIGREATLFLASYHLTTWAICAALAVAIGGALATRHTAAGAERKRCPGECNRGIAWPYRSFVNFRSILARLCPSHPSFAPLVARSSWTTSLTALGLALRLYHYLRNPSLWHDEAALVVNVLDKSFGELLGPLRFSEAAPPLFLWTEKGVVALAGESLYALRFLPLLASCAALLLFVPVARRTLSPAAVPWAVLLYAVSDRLLWHACEAKQYSIEVFVSVLLMAVWLSTSAWLPWRRMLLFALLAPPLLCAAYPAAFLYGGVLAALLFELRHSRRAVEWCAYGLLCATVFATFALLLAGPIHAQRDETIVECWKSMSQFPDWTSPASVPGWMVRSTCGVVGYCAKPAGEWLTPVAAVGLVLLWRQGQRAWCVLLATPALLALGASCVKAYPYGGMRVMAYAAPAVFLSVAAGVPWCLEWLSRRNVWPAALLATLLVVPVARAGYIVIRPWDRADCAAAVGYVEAHRKPNEMVTANHWEYLYYFRRLGRDFVPLEDLGLPRERMWVVVTGALPADREPCLVLFSSTQWTTLDRQEFDRTTVLLVKQRGTPSAGDAGPLARRP